ncbi:MAG TPA: ECF-type sigma factor [Thermoanaerobaculia bacterium]|nr:ECF-type sigma factor [Thermoanaerobaculia bacterium]
MSTSRSSTSPREPWSPTSGSDIGHLFVQVYDELRHLAGSFLRRERPDHKLQPTALVHEVFMKLSRSGNPDWRSRKHFFAIAARAMRQILVDHARGLRAQKRCGQTVTLDEALVAGAGRDLDLLALDAALEKLAAAFPERGRIVELHFFGGLSVAECAEVLGLGERTVYRQLRSAKAWLQSVLDEPTASSPPK